MRKLKLSLDELRVDSFHAIASEGIRGTVPGHAASEYPVQTCFGSCYDGCGGSRGCPPPATGFTVCDCATWETCPNVTTCG